MEKSTVKKYQKTILLDLDGVLNTYEGAYDENCIPEIREGAYDFIKKLSLEYKIKIFTSRNLLLTAQWIYKNKLDKYIIDITNIKEPSFLIIDDRCINFSGNYKTIEEQIKSFKPWYK